MQLLGFRQDHPAWLEGHEFMPCVITDNNQFIYVALKTADILFHKLRFGT